jgi:hypothetical protein
LWLKGTVCDRLPVAVHIVGARQDAAGKDQQQQGKSEPEAAYLFFVLHGKPYAKGRSVVPLRFALKTQSLYNQKNHFE